MASIYDIKQRADELAAKVDIGSIPPEEVGGLIRDLADYTDEVERNGGSLGIRKTYQSVTDMEADKEPVDIAGKPLKRGELVVIYDGTDTGADNNKVYAFQKPGWHLVTKLDAGYATRSQVSELEKRVVTHIFLTEKEYEALVNSGKVDPDSIYLTFEEED